MGNLKLADNQLPLPLVLVQTWCLLSRSEDEEVSQHAIQMLLNTFGEMKTVVEFVKANNINIG